MSYMKSTDSAVLAEFGRIMEEKDGLTKVAQAAGLSADEHAKLQGALAGFAKAPSNGPSMEKWIARLKGQTDPYLKSVHDALSQRYSLWSQGKEASEISSVPLPPAPKAPPAAAPAQPAPAPGRTAAVISSHEKTAEEKKYDVSGKEDLVNEAHPGKAMVEGELVENLNQQQDADKAVAEKSAKAILTALYKLAKRLEAEKNTKAYALVKETFLDLAKSLKK